MYVKPKKNCLKSSLAFALQSSCEVMGRDLLGAPRKEKCGASVNV